MATGLQHFLHDHRLVTRPSVEKCCLCGDFKADDGSYRLYGCEELCGFLLHKSCADIPRYIWYSLHPMHRLEIFQPERHVSPKCAVCLSKIDYFGHKCRTCDINLHYKCVAGNIFEPKDHHHDHSFINFKPSLYTCDACGVHEDIVCVSCICSICQLQVHPYHIEISSFSVSVRNIKHSHHKLKLWYSFEIEFDFTNKFCKICSLKMNSVLCLYQCEEEGCAYIAHASCATDRHYLMENSDHEVENEMLEPAGNDVILLEEDEQTEEQQEVVIITHFSHPHSLIFRDNFLKDKDGNDDLSHVCYGCVRPISVPFYTCDSEQCGFFLHKKCFDLPKRIHGPIHLHPLALKDFSDLLMDTIVYKGYTCQACRVRCNGFVYYCAKCDATFDVECALFNTTLYHKSHKCMLSLVSTDFDDGNRCIACGCIFKDAFWCGECNFYLDLKCASLPSTLGHDCPTGTVWSTKPLKLTFDSIFNASGQYYCDLCEETRDKDNWFYHCEDCHNSIHTHCLLGDAKFIYGKSYNLNGHCHAVILVEKPKTNILCDTCDKPCDGSTVIFCPTCKVYFHANVFCFNMDEARKMPIKNFCCDMSSSITKIEEEEKDGEITGVYHFSHPHSLLIGEYDQAERLLKEVCDGCMMPISAPFYTCAHETCNFFLHKECFELPKQIQHPFHADHPLVLKSLIMDWPENDKGGFTCYGCEVFSNGFVYTCLECEFYLDVRCSLLYDGTLAHERHQCTLTLINRNREHYDGAVERKCSACNSDCSSYRCVCEECDFDIGLQCALLPKVRLHRCRSHKYKRRPLHIRYGSSSEGHCRVCKDPLSENEWYYYCEDCKETRHVRCTVLKNNLMKLGAVYRAYNHFHKLTATYITKSSYACTVCVLDMIFEPGLYCTECEQCFHFKCCRVLRRVLQDSPVGGSDSPVGGSDSSVEGSESYSDSE